MSAIQTVAKERPIIMTGDSVRAILAGRKTQTRRVVKFHQWTEVPVASVVEHGPSFADSDANEQEWSADHRKSNGDIYVEQHLLCPYGLVGDRLWVRETWREMRGGTDYRTDYPDRVNFRWNSPIHMPRWASRITLEIVGVRVERLQEISAEDARAEGLLVAWRQMSTTASSDPVQSWRTSPDVLGEGSEFPSHKDAFAELWNAINTKRGYPWASNPWVWVIEFKVADGFAKGGKDG